MKDQYFGDLNDYRKYGLLRILADGGAIKIGVCWMLTDSDGTGHGKFIEYVAQSARWRAYDPPLFDCLHGCVEVRKVRHVSEAEKLNLIPSAIYFNELLQPMLDERSRYFMKMLDDFDQTDIVFFDPDNGFEVPSVGLRSKNAPKYLYWQELGDAFARKHSVLIYQHFPREKRDIFVGRISDQIRQKTNTGDVYCFRTATVGFFLAVQPRHSTVVRKLTETIKETWKGQISVEAY